MGFGLCDIAYMQKIRLIFREYREESEQTKTEMNKKWEETNNWLKVDEADPGFQLLTYEEIVESLNELNENETDSDEEGK